jgi:hypothetical protein
MRQPDFSEIPRLFQESSTSKQKAALITYDTVVRKYK